MPQNPPLDVLAQQGLEKCLSRLSRISTGEWRAAMVSAGHGKPRDVIARYAAAGAHAVFLRLTDIPVYSIMLVSPGDIECVSRGFTGHSFPRSEKTSLAEEIMLTELGNIMLNSLVNSLLNAVNRSAMPDLPEFIEGGYGDIEKALAAKLPLDKPCRLISAAVSLRCEGLASWTMHAFVPEELAAQIERP
ncbi:MAG: hypothetical protein M0011_10780 [Elusimicrobia bacterium]|nr:hypothetical protein [Elusimicrobiota bacterium]